MKKILTIVALLIVIAGFNFIVQAQTPGVNAVTGWAWSSNIGWISFDSTTSGGPYGVTVDDSGNFGGYAWSSNIGWISFNPNDLTSAPSCLGATPANVVTLTGRVEGWIRAYAAIGRTDGWDGCIELSGTNHLTGNTSGSQGVTYVEETIGGVLKGVLKGYAWGGPVVGWLWFSPNLPPRTYLCTGTLPSSGAIICPGTGSSAVAWSNVGSASGCTLGGICQYYPGSVVGGGITGTCNLSSTNVPINTSVQITLSDVSGGSGTYSYSWSPMGIGNGSVVSSNPYSYIYNSPGTYTPSIVVTGSVSGSGTITCDNITVIGQSTGLKLMIAPFSYTFPSSGTFSGSDYNDSLPKTAANKKALQIKPGEQFKLKWNIDPDADYDSCDYFAPTGFSWSGSGTNSGGPITMNTQGINSGLHRFLLTCSEAGGLNEKTSGVSLKIVNSSIEEI
ncbi:MAG: hypothetical protein A3G04_02060 [Candidatus Taylorbacteria bacterium RIFCSPLOWO2_12_FULL_44_9]|nr:MAG: hypothetical protein A3G04_02060 [Candidatus Taylorbacteria bacterium RIFCSPLOWO2_12_FULL_44_9]